MSKLRFNPIPSRFYKGVTNVGAEHPLAFYNLPDPAQSHTYFNDWSYYQANQWTVTSTGTSTIGVVSGDGGILSVATGATATNSAQITGIAPGYLPQAGFMLIARMRFQLVDALNSAFQFGLVNGSPSLLAPTDGFYFTKAAASRNLILNSAAASVVTSSAALTSLSDATYYNIALVYDGATQVHAFINNAMVASITPAALPSVILTRDFELQASTNAAQTLLMDYLFFSKNRVNYGQF